LIVVDTNVLVAALFQGSQHEAALRLAASEPDWAAPVLVRSELRNVFATSIRRRGLSLPQALGAMERGERLLAGRLHELPSMDVLAVADQSGCTAYDAEFVVLAQRLGALLVTEDRQLQLLFPKLAVPLSRAHLL
jgi:predicted nucleic acid-binding protein